MLRGGVTTGSKSRQVRGPGDGTISQRKDGRWEIRITDPVTGTRRSAYAKTEADARRKLRQMVTRKETGQTVLDRAVSLTDYTEKWLTGPALKGRRESTVREYRHRLETYVLPLIGRRKLCKLTVTDIELVLDGAAERGFSRSSLRGLRNAISAMLNDAVRSRDLQTNVAKSARLPDVAPHAPKARATLDEVAALLANAKGTELYGLLVLLVYTGCRVGEALGAKWSDFDLDAGRWQLTRTTTFNLDGQVVLGDRTKTGEPRLVHLQPDAVAVLCAQSARVAARRLKAGALWQDHDLVFPSTVGTAQDSRNLRKDLTLIAEEAGYRHSFHELRHVFATIAASEVSMASLSKVLGHRRLATTSDLYAHLYDPDAVKATEAVSNVFARRPQSS